MKFSAVSAPAPGGGGVSRRSGWGWRAGGWGAALLLLAGCCSTPRGKPLQRYEFTHPAMGTLMRITLYAPDPGAARAAAAPRFSA